MKAPTLLLALGLMLPSVTASPTDLYQHQRQEAKNPVVLHVFPEPGGIQGWISGTEDLEGDMVHLKNGSTTTELPIGPGNRFRWRTDSDEEHTIRLSWQDQEYHTTIPAASPGQPVAFFVVDRSVYRPETRLQFAAYLRQMNDDGTYQPLERNQVEVLIRSVSKKITVAKLTAEPDEFGRITGSYTFSAADPLDDYTIGVKDAGGTGHVKLAEFRKAKVRLDIGSEREGNTLKLTFQARDFLNKAVPASRVRFTANVRKQPAKPFDLWGLDPEQFHANHDKGAPWKIPTDEQWAMQRAGIPRPGGHGNGEIAHSFSMELEITEDEAVHELHLDPSWLSGHVLEIDGTLIDANNREQHASRTIALSEPSEERLELEVPNLEITAGQPMTIKASTSADQNVSFVLLRLETSSPKPLPITYQNPFRSSRFPRHWNHAHPNILSSSISIIPSWRQSLTVPQGSFEVITREYVSSLPSRALGGGNHESTLMLARPGAYIIQATSHDDAGRPLQCERTLVVHATDKENHVSLLLDDNRIERGRPLKGELHCAYDGARVLLTVRDGRGLQALHTITCGKGATPFEIPLPEALTVGCEIAARYTDDGTFTYRDTRPFYVEPEEQALGITTTVPGTAEPGDEVEIGISVNRREPVDLVVSVYDQSLLGIGPDRPVDARSLFHADLRVHEDATDRALEEYLGGLTPASVKAVIEPMLQDKEVTGSPLGEPLRLLHSRLSGKNLTSDSVRTLLAWRGAPVQPGVGYHGYWHINLTDEEMQQPIAPLLKRTSSNGTYKLNIGMSGQYMGLWVTYSANGTETVMVGDPLIHGNRHGSPYFWGAFDGAGGAFNNQIFFGGGLRSSGFATRADAAFSMSANSMHSLSGQAMISHMPVLAVPPPGGGPAQAVTVRRDFSDSAFFDAAVRTDDQGKARVRFKLPDSLTNWRVVVTAVTPDFHIARHTDSFKTFKPVMVWPMLSQSFTSGDRSHVFATVHNHTEKEQRFTVSAAVENGRLHGDQEQVVTVAAKSNAAVYFDFEAGKPGFTEILMTARCPDGQDASLKRLPVFPCTAEQLITRSGFVDGSASFEIPADIDLSQARLEVTVVPSMAGDMLDSLEYLVGYPHGCVEQTMSRFLPVIKVAQILERFEVEDEQLQKMVPKYASAGIKRLLELQQQDGGWGWNGSSGTHEMMTPYALLGLVEAQKAGFEIPSETAIPRGMERLKNFINGMGDSQSSDRIYCMWVYQHHDKLDGSWWHWLENITNQALGTGADRSKLLSDYAAAMAMEMAVRSDRSRLADKLERLLVHRAKHSGSQTYWTSANFSRWGNDRFEITAAVLKAFAAHNPNHPVVPMTLSFFASTKRGNRWNSTKDTAMILFAMCDYLSTQDAADNGPATTGVVVNDQLRELELPDWKPATLTIKGDELKAGGNQLLFAGGDPKHLYRMVFRYWRDGGEVTPTSEGAHVTRTFHQVDSSGKVLKELKSGDQVPRGAYIRSTIRCRRDHGVFNYTLATNPKPSCAEYTTLGEQPDPHVPYVLKENKAGGTNWHYESASNSLHTTSDYRVELDGEFLIPPAHVELMYDTEVRGHSGSFRLLVGEAGEKDEATDS